MSQYGTLNGGGVFPPGSVVQTLTGNDAIAVGPNASNNINVVGDGITVDVTGNAGTNTLTISAMGSVALQFDTDSGNANPSAGVIHMTGGTNMNSVGAGSVVTYNLDAAITLATSVTSPLYLAPAFGNFNIKLNDALGAYVVSVQNSSGTPVAIIDSLGNGVFSTVSGGNIQLLNNTIQSTNSNGNIVLNPNGTGKVTVNYATADGVPYFGASGAVLSTAALTNGQLLIGYTGHVPILGTITSNSGTITVTNGNGTINIETAGTSTSTYKNVNTSPYTVLTTDEYLSVDCSGGAITIKLPNAATTGQSFTIKDRTGNAATHNITITTVGGAVNIDGATSFVMNTNLEAVTVIGNSTSYEIY